MKNKAIVKFIPFLFIVLLVYACKEADKRTSIFAEYLSDNFGTKIPDSTHFYLLVPRAGCQGAMANTLLTLNNSDYKNAKNITVISSNEKLVKQYLSGPWKVISDTKANLDVLNLPVTNVTLVKTRNNTVVEVKGSRLCQSDIATQMINLIKASDSKAR